MIRFSANTSLALACTAFGLGAAAQADATLVMNGKVVSTGVIVVNGHAYVPINDVAKAQGMAVVKRGAGYEIKAAGGAVQLNGKLQGRLGEELVVGKWALMVQSVERADKYTSQFSAEPETTVPTGANDELVLIKCRLHNTKQTTQKAMLSQVHPHNTALTDEQGQSYQPVTFDKRGANIDTTDDMLPGSTKPFVLVFNVPKGTPLKDLVCSLQTAYDDYPDGGTDVRVTLKK